MGETKVGTRLIFRFPEKSPGQRLEEHRRLKQVEKVTLQCAVGISAFLFCSRPPNMTPNNPPRPHPPVKDHWTQGEYYLKEGVGWLMGEVILGGNEGVVGAIAGDFVYWTYYRHPFHPWCTSHHGAFLRIFQAVTRLQCPLFYVTNLLARALSTPHLCPRSAPAPRNSQHKG